MSVGTGKGHSGGLRPTSTAITPWNCLLLAHQTPRSSGRAHGRLFPRRARSAAWKPHPEVAGGDFRRVGDLGEARSDPEWKKARKMLTRPDPRWRGMVTGQPQWRSRIAGWTGSPFKTNRSLELIGSQAIGAKAASTMVPRISKPGGDAGA